MGIFASPTCVWEGAYLLHVYTYRICFVRYFTKYKSIFVTVISIWSVWYHWKWDKGWQKKSCREWWPIKCKSEIYGWYCIMRRNMAMADKSKELYQDIHIEWMTASGMHSGNLWPIHSNDNSSSLIYWHSETLGKKPSELVRIWFFEKLYPKRSKHYTDQLSS